ncbi:Zn-ribbon containing protein [Candidatus Anstonella stagnisolia]|nr:Zn-ribbon containing protein [Candidatus Anstonella stagnisolia]
MPRLYPPQAGLGAGCCDFMHTCMRCGRIIKTMLEMQDGCTCGSKAFIFTKSHEDEIVLPSPCTTPAVNVPEKTVETQKTENIAENKIAEKVIAPAQEIKVTGAAPAENVAAQAVKAPENPVAEVEEKDGQAPSLPPVIDGFEAEGEFFIKPIVTPKGDGFEIENVRLLESGVFEVDVLSLAKNPLVLKDQNDVYYVKLPLSKDISFLGNGKIEKEEKKAENKADAAKPEN